MTVVLDDLNNSAVAGCEAPERHWEEARGLGLDEVLHLEQAPRESDRGMINGEGEIPHPLRQ